MFRIRLTSMALALGLVSMVSGCLCQEGPMFPRMSNFFNRSHEPACECQAGQLPPEFAAPMPAPIMGQAPSAMPTITTVPATQPPQILKTPATTTPYFPPVN